MGVLIDEWLILFDGNRVFFETPEALTPLDTNGAGKCLPSGEQNFPACMDVYEWEAPGKGSCSNVSEAFSPLNKGCIYLISSGQSPYSSFFADASESGNDVFFFTREQLVGRDKDELQDVYDARVNGGLASQNPVPVVPCEGEGCKGAVGVPPVFESPGTALFQGVGNEKPKRPGKGSCPKGKVKRGGKCVKKSGKARHHKRHRRASSS